MVPVEDSDDVQITQLFLELKDKGLESLVREQSEFCCGSHGLSADLLQSANPPNDLAFLHSLLKSLLKSLVKSLFHSTLNHGFQHCGHVILRFYLQSRTNCLLKPSQISSIKDGITIEDDIIDSLHL